MDNEKDIIDLGNITVPTKWEEVTLKQFSEIERYYDGKDKDFDVREVLHIFCGRSIDEINSMPIDFVNLIMDKLMFLQERPKDCEPSNRIKIKGEVYQINVMEKLKTGEYVAIDTILKNDRHNYATLLAVLCRKEGEIYDSKFEAEVLDGRIKMFEGIAVTDVFPIISFFLSLWVVLETHSHLYSEVEEGINHIVNQLETSPRIGVFRRLLWTWRMTRLKRLLKSTSYTSQTHSHSLHTLFRRVRLRKMKWNFKRT